MVVKIEGQEDLLRAVLALDRAEGEMREAMISRADSLIEQTWQSSLMSASGTAAERKILATGASADITPAGFVLHAAQGPALSGGLDADHWPALEHGMTPKLITTGRRVTTRRVLGSNRPLRTAVLIWVGKNFKPRNYAGYVIFPTVRIQGPRYVAELIYGLIDTLRVPPLEIEKD